MVRRDSSFVCACAPAIGSGSIVTTMATTVNRRAMAGCSIIVPSTDPRESGNTGAVGPERRVLRNANPLELDPGGET